MDQANKDIIWAYVAGNNKHVNELEKKHCTVLEHVMARELLDILMEQFCREVDESKSEQRGMDMELLGSNIDLINALRKFIRK